jgi:hypothetical protein
MENEQHSELLYGDVYLAESVYGECNKYRAGKRRPNFEEDFEVLLEEKRREKEMSLLTR